MARQQGAEDGGDDLEDTVEDVAENSAFTSVARGGYVMSGFVHGVIGATVLHMALGDSPREADRAGALRAVAAAPGGNILLWIGGVAMVALMLWHLVEAWVRARRQHGLREHVRHFGITLGKAAIYGALSVTSLRFAAGAGGSSAERNSQLTAGLMGSAAGRALVVAVGLVVLGFGTYFVVKGITRRFEQDLRLPSGEKANDAILVTGVVGYIAKGVALLGVGVMVGWAALATDPEKASGLDSALQTIAGLPAGGAVLAVIGAGLVLYGGYCVLRSRYAPM